MSWPYCQISSVWINSMSSETNRQFDVTPDHPPVTELHAMSGEWAVLHSTLGPTYHMHKKEISSLSWSSTNLFHSPISHPLPLSLEEQEWGRTGKRRWRWKMKWRNAIQGHQLIKVKPSLSHDHGYLMSSHLFSWRFSQTLISISHACMNRGVWWPLTHHKGKMCLTPYHGAYYLMNPNLGVSFLTQSHVLGYKWFMGRDLD